MNKTILLKSFAMVWMGCMSNPSISANVTEVNRYATVSNKPLPAQVNPLVGVQLIHFPQHVKTIGDALTYWLQYSGFALVPEKDRSLALQETMHQPLPFVDRHLGPLTVQDGLTILVGQQVFVLIQDPLHRTINFKLKSPFIQGHRA